MTAVPKNNDELKQLLLDRSRRESGACVAFEVFGDIEVKSFKRRCDVPDYYMERPLHRDGLAVNGRWIGWTRGQIQKNQDAGYTAE